MTTSRRSTCPAPDNSTVAEVRYVGVSPRAWGGVVGRQLMAAVPDATAKAGFKQAVLLVCADNTRAVRLYEGLGWRAHEAPTPHPRSGKPEQQFRLDLNH